MFQRVTEGGLRWRQKECQNDSEEETYPQRTLPSRQKLSVTE
jgi:hypothetical protein